MNRGSGKEKMVVVERFALGLKPQRDFRPPMKTAIAYMKLQSTICSAAKSNKNSGKADNIS